MSAPDSDQGSSKPTAPNEPPLTIEPGRLSLRSRLKTKATTKLFSSSKHSKLASASASTAQGERLSQPTESESTIEESAEKLLSRPIFELWDEAYDELAKKDKSLITDYEVELSKSLVGAFASSAMVFSGLNKVQRCQQMKILLAKKIEEVDEGQWKLNFKGHELKVKDLVTPVVGIIDWAKNFIGDALEPSPYGSIAWAGVCLLLSLVLNPSKQEAVRVKGLDHIATIISRCMMREALYHRRYGSNGHDESRNKFDSLHVGYRDALRTLYVEILEFQATSACFLAKNTFARVTGDMVTWNNWDTMLGAIKEQENILESIEKQWRDMKYDDECKSLHDRHEQRMGSLNAIEAEILRVHDVIRQAQNNYEREKLLKWLSSVDPSKNYNSACKGHAVSTGDWLVKDSGDFRNWQEAPNSLLWLHGPAGSGKSFLSASVIRHLERLYGSDPYTAIAYFYFSFADTEKQNAENMLRSIIVQLCGARPDTPKPLLNLQSYQDKNLQPGLEKLEETFQASTQDFKNVYLVIDALDECPLADGEREQLLELLVRFQKRSLVNLHVLYTSRSEPDIMAELAPLFIGLATPIIDLQEQRNEISRDIHSYIDQKIATTAFRSWSPKTKQEVKSVLADKANGMFLYVALQLKALQKTNPSPAAISKALVDLPEGLDETYNRALSSIAPHQQAQAIRSLKWLAFSMQPLTISELAEASIIDPEMSPPFDEGRRYFSPMHVLDFLPGLVTVVSHNHSSPSTGLDEEDDLVKIIDEDSVKIGERGQEHHTIRIAHFSIKEYLESDRIQASRCSIYSIKEISANIFIAETCLVRLLQFDKPDSVTEKTIELPLVDYAVQYWAQHARWAGQDAFAIHVLIMEFFVSKREVYINWIRLFDPERPWMKPNMSVDIKTIASPLYYASLTGLVELVNQLLGKGADINAQGGHDCTALHVASAKGHDRVVQLLLEEGANLESKGIAGRTPLSVAAEAGNEAVVKILLGKGAELESKDTAGRTPLFLAAHGGNEAIVELLLEKGAELELRDGHGLTPLSFAASVSKNAAIVDLLLRKGAELDSRDVNGYTPLSWVALGGNVAMVALLLEHGSELNSKNVRGQTPLSLAAEFGERGVVKLLLEKGAELEPMDNKGRTPLSLAAEFGDETVVKMLLKKGAKPESKDNNGHRPLSWAAMRGRNGVVNILLEHGADTALVDSLYN